MRSLPHHRLGHCLGTLQWPWAYPQLGTTDKRAKAHVVIRRVACQCIGPVMVRVRVLTEFAACGVYVAQVRRAVNGWHADTKAPCARHVRYEDWRDKQESIRIHKGEGTCGYIVRAWTRKLFHTSSDKQGPISVGLHSPRFWPSAAMLPIGMFSLKP